VSGEAARDADVAHPQATATSDTGASEPPTPADTDTVPARIAAHFVDLVVTFALAFGGYYLGIKVDHFIWTVAPGVGTLSQVGYLLNLQLALLGFLAACWHAFLAEGTWEGQTVGKRLFGIRVVTESGDPPGSAASAIRNLLELVDGLFLYALGCALIASSDMRQRFGDRVANTVVVAAD